MKKLVFILIFVFALLNVFGFENLSREEMQYLSTHKEIVFTGQNNYQPFEFLNEKGEYSGLSVDIIKHIAKLYNFKATFMHQTFYQGQQSVLNDSADVLTSFFYSDERNKKYDFTNLLFKVPAYIFISSERTDISKPANLRGKIIAMQKGDYARDYLQKHNIVCKILYVDDFKDAVKLVAKGKADALIGDEQITEYHIYKNKFSKKIKHVGDPLYVGQDCMAVKKGNKILLGILNKGITYCRKTGYIKKSSEKWIGLEYKIADRNLILFAILGFIILILIAIILVLKFENIKKKSFLKKQNILENISSENILTYLYHKAGCCEIHTHLHGDIKKYTEFDAKSFHDNFWQNWKILVHPEDRASLPNFDDFFNKKNMEFSYRIQTYKNETRWFKTITYLMPYDDQMVNLIIVSIDITKLIKNKGK